MPTGWEWKGGYNNVWDTYGPYSQTWVYGSTSTTAATTTNTVQIAPAASVPEPEKKDDPIAWLRRRVDEMLWKPEEALSFS
jgi:hypothetical protein